MNRKNFLKSIALKIGAVIGGICIIKEAKAQPARDGASIGKMLRETMEASRVATESLNDAEIQAYKDLEQEEIRCKEISDKINKIFYDLVKKELRPNGIILDAINNGRN